jgi:hypothetical protein
MDNKKRDMFIAIFIGCRKKKHVLSFQFLGQFPLFRSQQWEEEGEVAQSRNCKHQKVEAPVEVKKGRIKTEVFLRIIAAMVESIGRVPSCRSILTSAC